MIEEYETSQKEMRAANGEMQSANEELRSTMEELETSKEELPSVGEELQTSPTSPTSIGIAQADAHAIDVNLHAGKLSWFGQEFQMRERASNHRQRVASTQRLP